VNSQVGVSQLLKSGGQLSGSLANDILRYYTGDPRKSLISILTVNLSQPLLRGFGRNNPLVENLTQSQRNVVYAVRTYSFFQDQFALEILNDHFALLAQKDITRNRYTNYLGRVQSTKRLEARAADRERLADVDQARQAELTAKNNYVNAVALYRNQLDQFKIKLGLPVGEKLALDDRELDELEQNGLVPARLDPVAAYRVAAAKQLQILNAIDQFEDKKRKVRVAANQLQADLNVVGGADLSSQAPTDYSRFDPNQVRANVGLQLNLPIDRLPERNSYRSALVTFEAELRTLTLTLDNLKESIEQGLRTLEQRRQNYEIQKNALDLANRRVDSTTLLLEAGRAEVRDLVDAQDSQISSQNAVTAALVDYQQTRLQLLLDIGALDTEAPKFWLKDNLAAYLPGKTPAPGNPQPPDSGEQSVLPPDQYFSE
jgi:outer membrane protein TolC